MVDVREHWVDLHEGKVQPDALPEVVLDLVERLGRQKGERLFAPSLHQLAVCYIEVVHRYDLRNGT
jgi:hypothetical protein